MKSKEVRQSCKHSIEMYMI